jgi:predicted ATP-binding protein involved in virulence
MRITKIHLQNIGVFEDTIIEFPEKTDPDKAEIHILTGENGTGKSTVLYAISNLQQGYDLFNGRSRFRDSRSSTKLYFDDGNDLTYTFNQANYLIFTFSNTNNPPAVFHYLQNTDNFQYTAFQFAFFAYSSYRSISSLKIGAIQELTNSPFENALSFNNSINPAYLMQWIANTKTKEALEFLNNAHNNSGRYRKSITRIERAIAEIVELKIEFVLEIDPLAVVLRVEDKVLSFEVLPDGLKSIISWIADLLMRMDRIKWATDVEVLDRNFILFLDEIDVHLHPAWQRKVLPAVQKLFKNAQIFVSTHSPFVVGSVDGAWVHKLVLDEKGNSQAQPPKLSEDGESYRYILREVFDIDKDFGPGTEADLERFNELKKRILHKQSVDKPTFLQLARSLAEQSIELTTIIGSELRQLSRITQEEFDI